MLQGINSILATMTDAVPRFLCSRSSVSVTSSLCVVCCKWGHIFSPQFMMMVPLFVLSTFQRGSVSLTMLHWCSNPARFLAFCVVYLHIYVRFWEHKKFIAGAAPCFTCVLVSGCGYSCSFVYGCALKTCFTATSFEAVSHCCCCEFIDESIFIFLSRGWICFGCPWLLQNSWMLCIPLTSYCSRFWVSL